MALRQFSRAVIAFLSASLTLAQFPPTPENNIVKTFDHYSISYKRTTICETQAKAWSGYVHMPSSYLGDLVPKNETVSLFFWYFEARNNPQDAPVTIYLAGGPGQTSMYGVTWEGGPCHVTPDSKDTVNNPWSWSEHSNMLFIDQPVGTGYSYNEILKSTYDLLTGTIVPFSAYGDDVPAQNATLLHGNFPSQDPSRQPNSTEAAARTLWHFSQAWFKDFPEYSTCDKRVSIWGNSHGGYWAPATGAYMAKQNEKIQRGSIDGIVLQIDQVGSTNGAIDLKYQAEWWPQMAYKNTYGLKIINETMYEAALHNYHKPNGCKAKIDHCREVADQYDPEQLAANETVNKACMEATDYCAKQVIGVFELYTQVTPRSAFDIAQNLPDPFPQPYLAGYFNQDWVQRDLGVPVNLTHLNSVSGNNFFGVTGDPFRREGLKDIEYLLSKDVKVTLVYGDRDYRCPWNGAEKLSLAAEWDGQEYYARAGYEEIRVNEGYVGGVVKQYGGLSFARVFQAGHHGKSCKL